MKLNAQEAAQTEFSFLADLLSYKYRKYGFGVHVNKDEKTITITDIEGQTFIVTIKEMK